MFWPNAPDKFYFKQINYTRTCSAATGFPQNTKYKLLNIYLQSSFNMKLESTVALYLEPSFLTQNETEFN